MRDAFRHCYASCQMTREYGAAIAWLGGEMHEIQGDLNGQPASERCMDVSNNAFGTYLGQNGNSCSASCYSAAKDGLLTVLK